ncbi:MAG: hypothetical protein JO081_19705 [Alphaproteobacteria bacterium]|nr:hypothetical protein [Alphaproteobacteria bacterium]
MTSRLTILICFGLLMLAGCMAEQAEKSWQQASIPPLQPGMARVWVLRTPSQAGLITGADPMVYANGAPLAQSPVFTVYYHDFPPGTYRFTVQAFGTPAHLFDTVELAPDTQTYLQVQAIPNWEAGSTVGGASFAVLTMAPEIAKPYLPTMKYLGER